MEDGDRQAHIQMKMELDFKPWFICFSLLVFGKWVMAAAGLDSDEDGDRSDMVYVFLSPFCFCFYGVAEISDGRR